MKRPLSSALILGLLSFPAAGLVGCGEESKKRETTETVSTPGGTTTTTSETRSNRPARTRRPTARARPARPPSEHVAPPAPEHRGAFPLAVRNFEVGLDFPCNRLKWAFCHCKQ